MLARIIQKEIRTNVANGRFVIAGVVSILLVVSSVTLLTNKYVADMREYHERVQTQENFIDKYGYLDEFGRMTVPQRGLSSYRPFVLGVDRELLSSVFLSNPMPVFFLQLDLVNIVTIILSLMAIMFSYNAITSERESGLLKQLLTTNVTRKSLVFGKFIGGSLSLMASFTIGILAGIVVVIWNPELDVRSIDILVCCTLLLASYLLISFFYAVGLYFSCRSRSSNVAILKSLFAWVVIALVIPNASPFIAAQLYSIPSKARLSYQLSEIRLGRFNTLHNRTKELLTAKYSDLVPAIPDISYIVGANKRISQQRSDADPHFKKRFDELQVEWRKLQEQIDKEVQSQISQIQGDFDRQVQYQENLATMLASISPVGNYIFVATNLTDTGVEAENRWQEQLKFWWGFTLSSYLKEKIEKLSRTDPTLSYVEHVDLSDHPQIQYQPLAVGEKMINAIPRLFELLLLNVIVLLIAMSNFLKYDVR